MTYRLYFLINIVFLILQKSYCASTVNIWCRFIMNCNYEEFANSLFGCPLRINLLQIIDIFLCCKYCILL